MMRRWGMCEGHGCDEIVEDVNVESYELTGKILCEWCVEEDVDRRANDSDDLSPVQAPAEETI